MKGKLDYIKQIKLPPLMIILDQDIEQQLGKRYATPQACVKAHDELKSHE
jgi:hypothetical protein